MAAAATIAVAWDNKTSVVDKVTLNLHQTDLLLLVFERFTPEHDLLLAAHPSAAPSERTEWAKQAKMEIELLEKMRLNLAALIEKRLAEAERLLIQNRKPASVAVAGALASQRARLKKLNSMVFRATST
ncbi:MAG: hypothetical protein V4760_09980 [Bdellovibrionota bacterium]